MMLSEAEKQEIIAFLREARQEKISIKFCERFDENSKIWNLKEHSHPYMEIIYFLEGKASIHSGNRDINVSLYDLLIYPPGILHKEYLDRSVHQEIICLWVECKASKSLSIPFKLADDSGELGWLCQCVHRNHLINNEASKEIETSLLRLLLLFMEQKLILSGTTRNPAVDRCVAYIKEHYAEEFDLKKLASISYVTSSYLSRLFKKFLNMTPMQYKNYVRLENSKHLLLINSSSIEEIANMIGFNDTKHFSSLFKKRYMITPTQFRKKYMAL